jgi:hypothetical protein
MPYFGSKVEGRKNMSKKSKIEKDYDEYNATIEHKTQEEIKKIKNKIEQVKEEAEKVGEKLQPKATKYHSKGEEKS